MRLIKLLPLLTLIIFSLSCKAQERLENTMQEKAVVLSSYSSEKPAKPVNILFIHHSTGGHLLAEKGVYDGENCIYKSHPNGGGLRKLLLDNNYIVHEASYKSKVGDKTDICDWNAKFRDHMDLVLSCRGQDEFFQDGTHNSIVIFKSCFPNNWIQYDGEHPGNPDSCEKTLANAQTAYRALLPRFMAQPDTLFVVMTAPPMAKPVLYKKDRIKETIKVVFGRPDTVEKIGKRARFFNNWLKDADNGWLKDYKLKNVVVFDYYDILTGYGKSDWSVYPTRGGLDSHPSSEGNSIAAKEFIPFLNKAYHRHRAY